MKLNNCTYSTLSSDKLNLENIRDLFAMMEKANKEPYIVKAFIRHDDELDEFKKISLAKDIGIKTIYGIPIYILKYIPKNIMRFKMSDGKLIDVKIK
jgi:hypothetical protein